MGKKILLALGILGMVLSGIGLIVSILLPTLTENRVSSDEALLGIIPSTLIFFLSLVIAVVGLILVLTRKKPPRN
jgi:Na+/H+ antiporter NhaD/arsenite permease-like protein